MAETVTTTGVIRFWKPSYKPKGSHKRAGGFGFVKSYANESHEFFLHIENFPEEEKDKVAQGSFIDFAYDPNQKVGGNFKPLVTEARLKKRVLL